MPTAKHIQYKIESQTGLLFRYVYISSGLTTLLAILCIYPLKIYGIVPISLFSYGLLNLLNVALFKKNGNLKYAAIRSAVISLFVTFIVILFSGGINSPFIFILGVIVLGGYAGARIFGTIYLFAVMGGIFFIYLISEADFTFIKNTVPLASEDHFSLLSVLFAVYLVGGVFGKNLLRTHYKMKNSQSEMVMRINEKEMLLREVHHRVKNNLQTVSSLLNLQNKNSHNEQITTLVEGTKNRVNSMAMIHEMLYVRADLSRIKFRPYVQELTDYLLKSVESPSNDVNVHIEIPNINLGIDTAISLGLLINEALTNSLKYGFLENSNGQISLKLSEGKENSFTLEIKDNGIGFPEDVNHKTTRSLGLKLIHNLARQLRGSVTRDSCSNGTHYYITFKDVERKMPAMG